MYRLLLYFWKMLLSIPFHNLIWFAFWLSRVCRAQHKLQLTLHFLCHHLQQHQQQHQQSRDHQPTLPKQPNHINQKICSDPWGTHAAWRTVKWPAERSNVCIPQPALTQIFPVSRRVSGAAVPQWRQRRHEPNNERRKNCHNHHPDFHVVFQHRRTPEPRQGADPTRWGLLQGPGSRWGQGSLYHRSGPDTDAGHESHAAAPTQPVPPQGCPQQCLFLHIRNLTAVLITGKDSDRHVCVCFMSCLYVIITYCICH